MTQDEIIELIHENILFYKRKFEENKKNLSCAGIMPTTGIFVRRLNECTIRIYALRDLLEDITGETFEDEDL